MTSGQLWCRLLHGLMSLFPFRTRIDLGLAVGALSALPHHRCLIFTNRGVGRDQAGLSTDPERRGRAIDHGYRHRASSGPFGRRGGISDATPGRFTLSRRSLNHGTVYAYRQRSTVIPSRSNRLFPAGETLWYRLTETWQDSTSFPSQYVVKF